MNSTEDDCTGKEPYIAILGPCLMKKIKFSIFIFIRVQGCKGMTLKGKRVEGIKGNEGIRV